METELFLAANMILSVMLGGLLGLFVYLYTYDLAANMILSEKL